MISRLLLRKAGGRAKVDYLRERIAAFPDLTAMQLTREVYNGAYTAVKRFVAAIRPDNQPKPSEVRFETLPDCQAQVDFTRFVTTFTDEPEMSRIVWRALRPRQRPRWVKADVYFSASKSRTSPKISDVPETDYRSSA